MAPLFSTVDLNKLWHDVQNEETLIYAKFGKDLFNISKVIGRKKWPSFLTHSVYTVVKPCSINQSTWIQRGLKWMLLRNYFRQNLFHVAESTAN